MFLSRRACQTEYFDAPERSDAEIEQSLIWLGRVNRITRFERPFRLWIPRLLSSKACSHLRILDLGAGDGSLGRCLKDWAGEQGWDWQFTQLDLRTTLLRLNPKGDNVVGNVLDLPFADHSFDVVIASTMTHHLDSDMEVIRHFQEANRVASRLVLLSDMRRHLGLYMAIWGLLHGLRAPKEFISDGLLSVRRGWRVEEWSRLACAAGLDSARVWGEHGARVLLAVLKTESAIHPGPERKSKPIHSSA